MTTIRARIERAGERVWQYDDFRDLPFAAVAKALSRLAKTGELERLSKGVYYRSRQTAFGPSRPNPTAVQQLASRRKSVFPAGTAAAGRLGFTTQAPARGELATSGLSLPRKLVGNALIHTRRPEAWSGLSADEAAILDLLRRRGHSSELSAHETTARLLSLLSQPGRLQRLIAVADTEPPRVRAMLGALGEALGKSPATLRSLRESLNPLSKFDFGMLATLPSARSWQAKERRP